MVYNNPMIRKCREKIWELAERVLDGKSLTKKEKEFLFTIPDDCLLDLISAAHEIKIRRKGRGISTCSIISAKTGMCSEDCAFCAQSSRSSAKIEKHSLLPPESILDAALKAEDAGAERFSIVTSGKRVSRDELEKIVECVEILKNETSMFIDVSLGILGIEEIELLKNAGVDRIHHNIETSPSYFSKIVTTHSFRERERTIRNVKLAGLEVCSGFIIGMGESVRDRIEMAEILNVLNVDSVPINILIPIKGTGLENMEAMTPLEAVKSIAAFRFLIPDREIRLCGGRVQNLRDLQVLAMFAVDGILIGHKALTTPIREPEMDIQMLRDLGIS